MYISVILADGEMDAAALVMSLFRLYCRVDFMYFKYVNQTNSTSYH